MRYLVAITFGLAFMAVGARSFAEERRPALKADAKLAAMLKPIRKQHDVPALAAAVVSSKGLQRIAAVGLRKRGDKTPVGLHDQFHLGSNTKAMTAALIAKLVEDGKLRWEQTLAESFPELKKTMAKNVGKITLLQLLAHRAGLPPDAKGGWWQYNTKAPVTKQRLRFVAMTVRDRLNSEPGKKYVYSNAGYVFAAAMAERATKKSWNSLLATRVFKPLKMTQFGFGPVESSKSVNQPWSHNAKGVPQPPGPAADNPAVMGPAGRVHATLPAYAKFLADQLQGARGQRGLLKAATYKRIHKAEDDGQYATAGWITIRGGVGRILTHDGSNTLNYCTAWLLPDRDLAVVVVCNQGGDSAKKACHTAVDKILRDAFKPK